jgi:hypothetical protein
VGLARSVLRHDRTRAAPTHADGLGLRPADDPADISGRRCDFPGPGPQISSRRVMTVPLPEPVPALVDGWTRTLADDGVTDTEAGAPGKH